jgi:HAMP domain-containing protein
MKPDAVSRPTWIDLRARLWLVMLVVLLPALAYIATSALLERQRARAQAQADLLNLARLAANEQKQALDDMQRSLSLVAQLAPVQAAAQGGDPAACTARLAEVAAQNPAVTGYGVWKLSGEGLCASPPLAGPQDASSQSWFRQAAAKHSFSVGDFQLNGPQGQPVLSFGYPITGSSGQMVGVISSGLELGQLFKTSSVLALPADAVVTVFDHNGLVLARSVDAATWVGKSLPNAAGLMSTLSSGASVIDQADIDGTARLSAFVPVPGPGGNLVYLSIGRPVAAADGPPNVALVVGLAVTLVLTLLAMALAAWWSRQTLLRPMRGLLEAADRLEHGDLAARALPEPAGSEVDRLASTLNTLAARLQKLKAERQTAAQTLDDLEARLRRSQAQAAQLEAVTAGLAQAGSALEVVEVIQRLGAGPAGALTTALLLLTPDGGWLKWAASAGRPDPIDRLFQQFPVSSPLPAADVVRTGESVWIDSAQAYRARYPQLSEVINATDYEAAVAVPLRFAGRLMGVLVLSFPAVLTETSDLANYLAALASLCAQALERARLQAESQRPPGTLDEPRRTERA